MSDFHVESTTSASPAAASAAPGASSASSASPSKPAWPFALLAWGLIVALIVFEMAC